MTPNADYVRYYREFKDSLEREEITESEYRSKAEGSVVSVDVAVESGFQTAFARYWTEREA